MSDGTPQDDEDAAHECETCDGWGFVEEDEECNKMLCPACGGCFGSMP